jgi:hypothetical protein
VGLCRDKIVAQIRYKCDPCFRRREALTRALQEAKEKDAASSTPQTKAAVTKAQNALKGKHAFFSSLNPALVSDLATRYPDVAMSIPAYITKQKAVTMELLTYIIQEQARVGGGSHTLEASLSEMRSVTHQRDLAAIVSRMARTTDGEVDFSDFGVRGWAMKPTAISDTYITSVVASWWVSHYSKFVQFLTVFLVPDRCRIALLCVRIAAGSRCCVLRG